jgi:hypothetical protein
VDVPPLIALTDGIVAVQRDVPDNLGATVTAGSGLISSPYRVGLYMKVHRLNTLSGYSHKIQVVI